MSRTRAASTGARVRRMTINPRTLDPGEEVLWSGRPHAGHLAFQEGWWNCLLGLFIFGIACGFTSTAYDASGFQFLGNCALIIGGLCIALTPVWKFYEAKHTIYMLTDRRAITQVSGIKPYRRSVPLSQIRYVEMRPSEVVGIGSVYFQDIVQSDGEISSLHRQGFVAIEAANKVELIFRRELEHSLQ